MACWQPFPTLVDVHPSLHADALVSVQEGEVALAGCMDAGWLITQVENSIYGNVGARCNSTLSYL